MSYPDELKYTSEHEWLRVEGDLAVVGITHYAQHQLGDIVFVELPEAGTAVAQGDAFGVVESTKSVSDLFAPVSGTIEAVNDALLDNPERINASPYDEAWMIKIRLGNAEELASLLDAATYQKQLED